MQMLYARDQNGDGIADGWVRAGDWPQEDQVMAIRIALRFVSERAFKRAESEVVSLLDESIVRLSPQQSGAGEEKPARISGVRRKHPSNTVWP